MRGADLLTNATVQAVCVGAESLKPVSLPAPLRHKAGTLLMNPSVTQDMSVIHLIGNASLPVQLVMALLLLASFLSWWYIFRKLFVIRQAMKQSDEFENVFWKGSDLNALFQSAAGVAPYGGEHGTDFRGRLSRIHQAQASAGHGCQYSHGQHAPGNARDLPARNGQPGIPSFISGDGWLGESLCRTVRHGMGHHEFVSGLSNVTQATIAHVAPGIAEALIATAMGLFAAIPAVIAYNRYASQHR